jgi:hypothetical protein
MSNFEFEFVDDGSIDLPRRGRKSTVPVELVNAIRKLTSGKVLVLKSLAVSPKASTVKTDKARHGATIRQAAKMAGVEVSIGWAANGTPAVKLRK